MKSRNKEREFSELEAGQNESPSTEQIGIEPLLYARLHARHQGTALGKAHGACTQGAHTVVETPGK